MTAQGQYDNNFVEEDGETPTQADLSNQLSPNPVYGNNLMFQNVNEPQMMDDLGSPRDNSNNNNSKYRDKLIILSFFCSINAIN